MINSRQIQPGKYKHFKGGLYKVIGTGKHSETLKDVVVYRSLERDKLWVRPKEMFLESVEKDGDIVPRFERIE